MIRLSVAFIVALSLAANCAYAQVPGGGQGKASLGKASLQLLEKMSSGTSQDLIVVYDDKAIQEEAEAMQSQMGLPSHHGHIIEHKAARYAEKKQEVHSAFGPHEATVLKHYSHLPVSFVRIHSRAALDKLLAHPGVVGVYEDRVERLALAESLPLIGQPQAAAQGYQGAGTAVAVLDTGVDYTQAAFGSCISPGVPSNCRVVSAQEFAPGDPGIDRTHGTNVAGIVAGVAPGTKIVSLKVFGSTTASGTSTTIIDAMNWVIANKATYNIVAMNLSIGGTNTTSPVTTPYSSAFSQARAAGILPVAAAGNDGLINSISDMATSPGVVSVGAVYDSDFGPYSWNDPPLPKCSDATTAADKVACFSNSASFLTMLAPGCMIIAGNTNESWCGTSQATPHVAGAVAVLRAAFPNETLDQTVARLTNGVMVTDSRNDITKPRLNLQMALGLATSCTYSISATSNSFNSNSSSGSIGVTTGAGCTWGAASNTSSASWITVSSGSSGSGNGTVNYSVSANPNSFSRTGTLTVAGQIYTVTQSGSTGTLANILLNPGFESGPVSWTSQTANGYPVISTYLNPVANNSWYAWLCGYNNCADSLYQDVTIPADAQNAYVQFKYWIKTAETSTVTAYDSMAVRIYSPPSASTYATCPPLSNLNATTGYVQSTSCNLIGYKGQTIRLQFSATTDSTLPTSFFVDDVVLMVSGATPDTQAPTMPTGLTATATSSTHINLAWTASSDNVGVTAYKVYLSGTLVATLGNVTSSLRTNAPSTTYSYTVSACDAAGNCSAQSAPALATTPAFTDTQAPTVPTGLTATATSSTHINLTWNASTDNVGVTAYKVYSGGTLVATLGNVTSSLRTNAPSTTYSYTVSACDAAGNCSAQSTAVLATTTAFDPQTGWWWNPAEGGRGFAIEMKLGKIFMAGFLYDSNGLPTWFVATGPSSGNVFTATMQQYSGGQTLTGPYKTPTATASGAISIAFQTPTTAVMTWPGGNVSLQRFDITQTGSLLLPPPSFLPERGWWWNAAEGGRGYALEIQGDNIFIGGFMYDTNGKPIWYVSNGKMATSSTYYGAWHAYGGGQSMTGPYQAPTATVVAGSIGLSFSDTSNGVLTLPNGTQVPITRFTAF